MLKCINNKCPEFCHLKDGKCYSKSKNGKPWGLASFQHQYGKNHEIVYDADLLVFGTAVDVKRYREHEEGRLQTVDHVSGGLLKIEQQLSTLFLQLVIHKNKEKRVHSKLAGKV